MSVKCCGSNNESYAKYDGYGIFLTYVCFECEHQKMSMYVDDIQGQYEHDEEL